MPVQLSSGRVSSVRLLIGWRERVWHSSTGALEEKRAMVRSYKVS